MERPTPRRITAAHFPTPTIAKGPLFEHDWAHVVAAEHAIAANRIAKGIADAWPGTLGQRIEAVRAAHDKAVDWRYSFAMFDRAGRGQFGGIADHDPERYRTPIDDRHPHSVRLGHVGYLHLDAVWDSERRTHHGGRPTQASDVAARYGTAVAARFMIGDNGAETFRNQLRLPSGLLVASNRLLRFEAAKAHARTLAATNTARSGTDRFDLGGDPDTLMFAVSGRDADRTVIRESAYTLIAMHDRLTHYAWWQAAYLLCHGPRMAKGSDAVTRVLLAAVGAALCDQTPVIPADLDLWCAVTSQSGVLTTAAARGTDTLTYPHPDQPTPAVPAGTVAA